MILTYIKEKKPLIDEKIVAILKSRKEELNKINQFGGDSIDKLIEFCTTGKSLRGVLVLLGAEMYGKKIDDNLLEIAAILEIIHSCILIQDDIQDDDTLRRGHQTVWYQFQKSAEESNFKKPKFYGESMAMDVFLIGHYIAMERLVSLDLPTELKLSIAIFLTQEVQKVGVAQSQDIYHGYVHGDRITIADIENVHLYKTGRYTIALPLALGALYAGKKMNELDNLIEFGEKMGIVFQIKDDELAIFAEQDELGKKVGNDISENKKTHFRELLYQRVNPLELPLLKISFGNKNLSEKKLAKIRNLLMKYGIRADLQTKIDGIGITSKEIIDNENISPDTKELLHSFVDYLLTRTK